MAKAGHTFRNTRQENLSFQEMFDRILNFIKDDPTASYRIAIGTDSQVRTRSHFVTGILVHRVGKGAVGFIREVVIPRNIKSLREKISLETAFTLEVAYMFTPDHLNVIFDTILSHGLKHHLDLEIHLDIGQSGPTKELIKEMVNRVSGLGFDVKIKPFATAASSLANRYTK
jgi:predicted RNase H-related nuclease YkuK (DUF458 family)